VVAEHRKKPTKQDNALPKLQAHKNAKDMNKKLKI
jgi:hypothetical protein